MRLTIGTGTTMDFFYDQNGQPFAMKYNGTLIYYVLNQQGDVVRLVNSSGGSYGVYYYDAWGNITYTTDSQYLENNPLRYRGYVYDSETELYYCQSRYYDPAIGRFINADAYASTGQGLLGNNMFAYCNNNPVNGTDPTGETPALFLLANATFGAIVGAVTQISTNIITENEWSDGVLGAALGGAVYNAVALVTRGNIVAASVSGAFVEAATNEAMEYTSNGKQISKSNIMNSMANVLCKTVDSTLTAAITGTAASKIVKTNSGWFPPKKLLSSFTGTYAQKVFFQTAVQGEMTMFYNAIKSANHEIDMK